MENGEIDSRIKKLLSRQNILNKRQIVAEIEEIEEIIEEKIEENRRKNSQSRRSSSWINQSYLVLLIKQIETKPRSHKQSAT